MKYIEHLPCPLLQPYVTRFWDAEFDITPGKVTYQSDSCTTTTHFIFCLKTIFKILRNGKISHAYPTNLVTPLTLPVINILKGAQFNVGVEFTATGFHKLWQIPIQAINSCNTDLHDLQAIIGVEALQVYQRLLEANISSTRFTILENFLLRRIYMKPSTDGLVEAALQVIQQKDSNLRIHNIAEQLNCTNRTLQRHFIEQTGVSPKTYIRIQRFIQARNQLLQNPNWRWKEGLVNEEYYDQAHFIKEFVEFSGRPPSAYVSRLNELEEFFSKRFN